MSFLLRRNRPKAWAYWHDLDATTTGVPNQSPVTQPWGQWNTSQSADRVSNELVFQGAGSSLFNAGGWAYEHQPFTSYWGCDFDINPSLNNTVQAQFFGAIVDWPWSKNKSSLRQALIFEIFHNSPLLTGGEFNRVMIKKLLPSTLEEVVAQSDLPGGNSWWNASTWHTISVLVDGDQDFRVFVDGAMFLFCRVSSGYTPSPGRRSFNFTNRLFNVTKMRNFKLYDREPDLLWSSIFFDDFNRAGPAVGNGWTQVGANASIQSNAWVTTGTTDGGRAILRDTGISNGRMRVEGTLSANPSNTNNADNRLILCGNSTAGTQGLVARINGNQVRIARFSSALSGNPPTFTQLSVNSDLSSNIVSGNTIGFNVRDGYAWIDRNGEPLLFAGNVHSVVPSTNQFGGLGVARSAFADSAPWTDARILQAA